MSAGREMFNWVPKAHLSSEYHTEEITPRSALGLHSWSYLNTVYHIQVSSYNLLLLCTHPRKLWQFTDLSDNQNVNLIMASPFAICFQVRFVRPFPTSFKCYEMACSYTKWKNVQINLLYPLPHLNRATTLDSKSLLIYS